MRWSCVEKDTGYPGTIGLFPRVLGQFVREEHLMTVEEAVRKMSSPCSAWASPTAA